MRDIVHTRSCERCRTPYWVWGMAALFLLVGTVPYAVAWFAAPAGATATGVISNPLDTNSYLANMQQGHQGRWLYVLPYTAFANRPLPLFSFYIVLGHLARLTVLSLPLVFHLARLACGALFVLAAYHFIARYLERPAERRLALFILLFTGGTGWIVPLVPGLSEITRTDMTPDLWLFDAVSFVALLNNGHCMLNMVLMMGMIVAGERLLASKEWRWVAVAWLCGLGIALVHAHQLAVVGLVLAGQALWRAWPARRIPWQAAGLLALIFAPGGLLAGALTLQSYADPQLASWLKQGNTYTPPVWGMVNLYGPVWALALAGAWHLARQNRATARGVLLWFLTVLTMIYLPVNFQRRFMEGWHVPVSILAATGWVHEIAPRLQRALTARAVCLVLILLLVLVTASPAHTLLTFTRYVVQRTDDPLVYAHADERGAVDWLREHATLDEVTLSYFYSGNWLPARAPVRSFLGHWSLTAEVARRMGEVEDFFDAATPDAERLGLLKAFGIDYVYVGPDERALGDFDARRAPYLALVYDSPSVQLYRVVLPNP